MELWVISKERQTRFALSPENVVMSCTSLTDAQRFVREYTLVDEVNHYIHRVNIECIQGAKVVRSTEMFTVTDGNGGKGE